ncbi:secreted RxLR effector protein 161-like [Solanum verrucosum]|uniref:secreted RxLR effector protein 161-like n=1 Tax=Solanum verrucosum TaxID=315347 RepID=UPI0020D159ED|nr:secreted RxLR effector protein 161-like [Solanum verrucosum]
MDCRSVAIPLAANKKFRKDDGEKKVNSSLYRSLIGTLLYLTSTRPDIMFAASLLSRFMQEPSQVQFGAAKRVLHYLQGTMDYGIMYKFGGNLNLIGYSDSGWDGSIDDTKSTSGYAFLFGSRICSWLSKKQSVVAQSTTKAEYVSAAKATSQAIWLRRIFEDTGEKQKRGTVLYCDNKSSIAIAKNPVNHERSKHISIKYHFIREAQEKGEISKT